MKKNTWKNRIKLYTQYYDQPVLKIENNEDVFWVNSGSIKPFEDEGHQRDRYLLLKPLSLISAEEVINIARIKIGKDFKIIGVVHEKNGFIAVYYRIDTETGYYESVSGFNPNDSLISVEVADYLRSKSFALPFLGISVENQVKFGWVQLEE